MPSSSTLSTSSNTDFVLGLDIGSESVGWCMLPADGSTGPAICLGVHTFDAGVEGDMDSGRDESRAAVRRQARMPRRLLWRRAARMRKLARILQSAGLLPPFDADRPDEIHAALNALDRESRARRILAGDRIGMQLLPYRLRALALDELLSKHELGRALYHLAQRRGFLSNKKAVSKDKDEQGKVKAGIQELQRLMDEANCRTLGEYFATLDPEQQRIRGRWTSRAMYEHEFNSIWTSQARHHPELTEDLRARVHHAIFFQRPLKLQRHLIGECSLVPGRKRAPMALRIAQRFRILQKVNDLLVYEPDGRSRPLTVEERAKLVDALEREGDLTFSKIKQKKYLALPAASQFNLQEGGEKVLRGNRTNTALRKVAGDRWDDMTPDDKDRMVEILLSNLLEETQRKRIRDLWSFDDETARQLAELELEDGYGAHCREALEKLVARMEDGTPYATARKELFPESIRAATAVDLLPPVLETDIKLRNPAVCRALTETRKLVNAIIDAYGKPAAIRIELARELKRPRDLRVKDSKSMRDQETRRRDAACKILAELHGVTDPSPNEIANVRGRDIEKVLLAEESNWQCPYTGRAIGLRELVGHNAQFDVEHILPFSTSMDNSFANKTLCYHEENRGRKRNHTPLEAYGNSPEWEQILERVRRFQGRFAREKLKRFEMAEIPADFTARQLNDTRYAARLAADYLGLLYGGRVDEHGRKRIFTPTGQVTAWIRDELGLNRILGDGGMKSRDDHRHHAVDAVAIALASDAIIKRLSDAAVDPWAHRRRLFAPIEPPWPTFVEDVRDAINRVNVSRRVSRKLAGKLHDDSYYSKPYTQPGKDGKPVQVHRIRKPLHAMSVNEIEAIVDPHIRKLVQDKLAELGGDPKRAFADPRNHPVMTAHDGRLIPIHKARIAKSMAALEIGQGPRVRYVAPGANQMAIVAVLDGDGRDRKWEGYLVSRFEAHQRYRRGEPIVQKDWPDGRRFVCSLAPGEMFTADRDGNGCALFVVRSVSEGRVEYVRANDARRKVDIKASKEWLVNPPTSLMKMQLQKVTVSYLGVVVPVND